MANSQLGVALLLLCLFCNAQSNLVRSLKATPLAHLGSIFCDQALEAKATTAYPVLIKNPSIYAAVAAKLGPNGRCIKEVVRAVSQTVVPNQSVKRALLIRTNLDKGQACWIVSFSIRNGAFEKVNSVTKSETCVFTGF